MISFFKTCWEKMIDKDQSKYNVLYSPDNDQIVHNPVVGKQRAEFLRKCLVEQYNENLVVVIPITEELYNVLTSKKRRW